MLVQPPLDLETHAPLETLQQRLDAQIKRFRRFHRISGPTLLFAGPYTKTGGLDIALETAYALRERIPELRFAAIPDGPIDRRHLDQGERKALAYGHRCVIEWETQPDEIPLWYAVATVVCLPATQPLQTRAPQHAAAAARPFIGSELEPLSDEILDGQTGFLTPPGDTNTFAAATEALLGDPDEATRLGTTARKHAEHHLNPTTTAQKLHHLWTNANNPT